MDFELREISALFFVQNYYLTFFAGRRRMPRPKFPLYHIFQKKSSKILYFSCFFRFPELPLHRVKALHFTALNFRASLRENGARGVGGIARAKAYGPSARTKAIRARAYGPAFSRNENRIIFLLRASFASPYGLV